jgi:hypothetical protein
MEPSKHGSLCGLQSSMLLRQLVEPPLQLLSVPLPLGWASLEGAGLVLQLLETEGGGGGGGVVQKGT